MPDGCWLRSPKRAWQELHAGDLVLLPRGAGHALASDAHGALRPRDQMPLQPIGERTYAMRAGGGGATSVLVCCSVGFAEPAAHPLLELMPPRSIFSQRFAKLVGMPPARYVARWRMHVASGWLENERVSIAEGATRLGYESEAAFSRAFKRFVGVPPGALRRAPNGVAAKR